MTIRINKLVALAQLEATAAKAWDDMSPRERQIYLKAHPNSKHAAGKGNKVVNSETHGVTAWLPHRKGQIDYDNLRHFHALVNKYNGVHAGRDAAPTRTHTDRYVELPKEHILNFRRELHKNGIRHDYHGKID